MYYRKVMYKHRRWKCQTMKGWLETVHSRSCLPPATYNPEGMEMQDKKCGKQTTKKVHRTRTWSYWTPLTTRPLMDDLTLFTNISLFLLISSAASEDWWKSAIDIWICSWLAFVQRIIRIRLEEKVLQSDHNRIEVENWLPILSKDVQAYIPFKIDIRMIYLSCTRMNPSSKKVSALYAYFLCALDLWGIVRIIGVDSEREFECATLVHA